MFLLKLQFKRQVTKSFKADTIKRLLPRSKFYYFSHSRASIIQKFFNTFHFSMALRFEIHFGGPKFFFSQATGSWLWHCRFITYSKINNIGCQISCEHFCSHSLSSRNNDSKSTDSDVFVLLNVTGLRKTNKNSDNWLGKNGNPSVQSTQNVICFEYAPRLQLQRSMFNESSGFILVRI